MKAITIMQPWASAIVFGMKQYETRSRLTKHRGLLAIHAGKKVDKVGLTEQYYVPWLDHIQLPLSRRLGPLTEDDFPTGGIVAVAEVVDCIEMDDTFIMEQSQVERSLGNWNVGNFAYRLENVQPLPKMVQIAGKQGLWNWNPNDGDLDGITLPESG